MSTGSLRAPLRHTKTYSLYETLLVLYPCGRYAILMPLCALWDYWEQSPCKCFVMLRVTDQSSKFVTIDFLLSPETSKHLKDAGLVGNTRDFKLVNTFIDITTMSSLHPLLRSIVITAWTHVLIWSHLSNGRRSSDNNVLLVLSMFLHRSYTVPLAL